MEMRWLARYDVLSLLLFQISKDENYIFCTCGSRVNVLEINTGKIIHSVEHVSFETSTI